MGAIETFAGLPSIMDHVKKLMFRSHVQYHKLAETHALCSLLEEDSKNHFAMSLLTSKETEGLRFPITELWTNQKLTDFDLDSVYDFATPGLSVQDVFPRRVVLDITPVQEHYGTSPSDKKKEHQEFLDDRCSAL